MLSETSKQRLHLTVGGVVQGVGFRPFVYRLATELNLTGWVSNGTAGVGIEVQGERSPIETFIERLQQEKPPLASITSLQSTPIEPVDELKFIIKKSPGGSQKTALVLPDVATCAECLKEIFEHYNRRYRYPFTNCTNCGPRFSIIKAIPYERQNTTMQSFAMCQSCKAEYTNPSDRRFHAQPNACPNCGPHLELWNSGGKVLAKDHNALQPTVEAIHQGKILAIKGLGGFHLVVDATNQEAVKRLRDRKHRPHKPLALMYPSLKLVEAHCYVGELERELLLGYQAPIVLLQRRKLIKCDPLTYPAAAVAFDNPDWGVMLPYTPLHHLLMQALGVPIVATSGNLSDEPICIDAQEALTRLTGIADLFVIHNRPIHRPIDDSVVRVMGGQATVLRRARGYAPLPIALPLYQLVKEPLKSILAVGGQLKNTTALSINQQVFLSQHLGDLTTTATFQRFKTTIEDFEQLYDIKPQVVATDLHPDYRSSQYAKQLGMPIIPVQHHYAHLLACMVDNGLDLNTPVLGVVWDGTGYGSDGTIWGGEFLSITDTGFERVAHLRTFRLPGGEQAVKQPKRVAIALLYEIFGDRLFTKTDEFSHIPLLSAFNSQEIKIIATMLQKPLNAPITSSIGRLFDGVAALIGIRQQVSYEGQAAMELEWAAREDQTDDIYQYDLVQTVNAPLIIDWQKTIKEILTDFTSHRTTVEIAAKFHNTLVETIVATAKATQIKYIVLTGGCWQNPYLSERTIQRLKQEQFYPYWHHQIPPNDGGIALGQIVAAIRHFN